MKVVLDTNVLITAFKDEYSYQKRIINEIVAGRVEAFANHQTLRENRLILNKIVQDYQFKKELDAFFTQVNEVVNRRQIRVVSDPEDNKILESAVEAKADYLITEDRALLELSPFRIAGGGAGAGNRGGREVKIVEPIEFWKFYEEQTGNDPWQKWIKFVSGDRASKAERETEKPKTTNDFEEI